MYIALGVFLVGFMMQLIIHAVARMRRQQASRWVPPVGLKGSTLDSQEVFDPVWIQTVDPARRLKGMANRQRGALVVQPAKGRVSFMTGNGLTIELDDLKLIAWRGHKPDWINTWITVSVGTGARATVQFINDGGWRGWRPLLTGSNRKLADALSAAAATRQETAG